MTQEQEPVERQEARVWKLTGAITAKLKTGRHDEVIVISDEDRGGFSSLTLRANGEWGARTGMLGSDIKNPTILRLLREYAIIKEDEFLGVRQGPDLQTRNLREQTYLDQNKPRLLQGLIENLDRTLESLSTNTHPM